MIVFVVRKFRFKKPLLLNINNNAKCRNKKLNNFCILHWLRLNKHGVLLRISYKVVNPAENCAIIIMTHRNLFNIVELFKLAYYLLKPLVVVYKKVYFTSRAVVNLPA